MAKRITEYRNFIWINLFLPLALSFNMTCPELLQRAIRSEYFCKGTSHQQYSCLFDEHNQSYVESCSYPDFVRLGQKYVVSGLRLNTDCSSKRYQPFKFWSNTSSQCVYRKSKCSEIGQIIVNNDSSIKDTLCRCDFTKGFGFIVKPRNPCFCIPSEEDCTCYAVVCPLNYTLTADYKCQPETILKPITFCSKIARNDKEITDQDLKSVSKTISKNISKSSERGIGIITCVIAITIALEVGVTVGLWLLLKQTDPESLNTKTGSTDKKINYQAGNTDNKAKDQHIDGLKLELTKFERELLDWINNTKLVIETLNFLANELDVNFISNRKEKIRGSAAGILGSVIGIAGISLSPFTFGASLGLVIAGGVIGGIGGVTIGHSFIKDNVLSKQSKRNANRELDRYSAASEIAKRRCLELSFQLQKKGEIEDSFPEWTKFWCRIAHGQEETKEQQKTNWKEIKNTIETSLLEIQSTSRFLGEGIGAGIRIAGVAVRITGTSLHVASGLIGALMIPLDIHTLVTSVNDERKKNRHETSTMITEISKAINNELPKEDDIKEMINSTLSRL